MQHTRRSTSKQGSLAHAVWFIKAQNNWGECVCVGLVCVWKVDVSQRWLPLFWWELQMCVYLSWAISHELSLVCISFFSILLMTCLDSSHLLLCTFPLVREATSRLVLHLIMTPTCFNCQGFINFYHKHFFSLFLYLFLLVCCSSCSTHRIQILTNTKYCISFKKYSIYFFLLPYGPYALLSIHLCILWPVGGAAASVPTTGWVAARLRKLDLEGWGVEGLPGGEDER